MVSTDNGEKIGGIEESNDAKVTNHVAVHISTSQRGLLNDDGSQNRTHDNFASLPKRLRFLKFGNLASPSAKFQQLAQEKEEVSRTVPSSTSLHLRERVTRLFSRKIDWPSLWSISKEWIRNPFNLAIFIWITCVAISGAILFLVMTGMLNHALPKKSQRNAWFEVNNQILNALFTLMCLYNHPGRFYNLALLLRWKPEDILKLRKIYCKNGSYKPHEWMHMMVVVTLLHLNCFAQYALCGLNIGYRRSERPAIGVGICISVAIGAPAAAAMYGMLSPLGRDYETELDEESLQAIAPAAAEGSRRKSLEKRFSFASRDDGRVVETRPRWSGGIFDLWDDISLAYLSLFCSFCVFGWNMERLGFGNMYVHIATFVLFCVAPFLIFNLAAVNIDNEAVREALGITGILLCVFGLLYGGFWRIQMRKRFNLPSYNFCCGKPAVSDCAAWLFCCWCSLAQEVRTGDSYDVVEDKFCKKQANIDDQLPISPMPLSRMPREDGDYQFRSSPSPGTSSSPSHTMSARSPSPTRLAMEYNSPGRHLPTVEEEHHTKAKDDAMTPPAQSVITREDI